MFANCWRLFGEMFANHTRVSRDARQIIAKRSQNGRQMLVNFSQFYESIANVVQVGRQLPVNASPNGRQTRETRERHLSIVVK